VNRVIGGESEAVTDVSVTDSVVQARAVSFFTVNDGKITRIVEYWPEPYDAPEGRAHLTERLTGWI
jgi:ketosteroid isomerase-like protein